VSDIGKEIYRDGIYAINERIVDEEEVFWLNRPIPTKASKGKSKKVKEGDKFYEVTWWDPATKEGGSFGVTSFSSAKSKLAKLKKGVSKELEVKYKGKIVKLKDVPLSMDNASELDPEIAETILELNSEGYVTNASCAGHGSSYSNHPGWISFNPGLSNEDITSIQTILKARGLKTSKSRVRKTPEATYVLFSPVGKRMSKKEEILAKKLVR